MSDTTSEIPVTPARFCAQIGQRKRYFDTREEAIAALEAFTEMNNKPKKK